MGEGAREGDRNNSSTSNSSTPHRAPRGEGRGRGRGRGRSRGRSGRGGRGRHSNNEGAVNSEGHNPVDAANVATKNTNHAETSNNDTGGGRGRGNDGERSGLRGGRSGGRGRSRGRGRGGRGRGRGRHGHKGSRSNSPVSCEGEDHGQEGDTSFQSDTEHKNDAELDAGVSMPTATLHDALPTWSETAPTTTLTPCPPRFVGGRGGVPMILTRGSYQAPIPSSNIEPIDHDSEAQKLSESMATAALEDFEMETAEEKKEVPLSDEVAPVEAPPSATVNGKEDKTRQAKPKKKKKSKHATENLPAPPPEEEEVPEITATDALKALPAQEVSITANTTVQIRRTDSSASLTKAEDEVIKVSGTGQAKKKGKSQKKKPLSKDDSANQKAAKAFNKAVRLCVERSDPDAMREILHDKRNHNFALDKTVLETVMKAYVMAAMFEDALYCLRNCTLPGTLSTIQTERILQCLPQNLRNSSAYTAADMINALCIATEFDSPTSRTYFLRIVRGISLEFLEEVMSARDRMCSAPCERLVRAAVCVVDARLKRGKKPTELIVEPGEQLGVFVPDSMENRGIQAGDAVSLLPYAGPYPMSAESLDRNMIEATVTNTNPMVLRLQDKTNASLHAMLTEAVEGNVYRIDKLANRMGFNRQLGAAVAIASPLGDTSTRDIRRPSPQLRKAITAMDENIERVMNQPGSFFKGELTSTAALCAQAATWNYEDESDEPSDQEAFRSASRLALDKYGALEGLNASQRLAVEGAVTNRLTLVQGPPGTGMCRYCIVDV